MCGIAGIQVAVDRSVDSAVLDGMEKALFHRGPDATGRTVQGNTALLSTRLAIIDLVNGDQPLFSDDGKALVVNGEIYNAPEIRAAFPSYGFQTLSDSEVVFPLYDAYSLDFPNHLRGMYAAALFDKKNGRLILARDQFGIKPLYYVSRPGLFAFASEPSALLDTGVAARTLDSAARAELLQLKYTTGTKTVFPDIRRVEAGETIVVENGEIALRRNIPVFPDDARDPSRSSGWLPVLKSPRELLDGFGAAMRDSVAVHLRSDVSCCLFYSGGVDSTVLAVIARRLGVASFHALTVGYAGSQAQDESGNALRLAGSLGIACERVEMSVEDFWNLAPRIAAAIDDPMADPAVLPLYMLGKAASARKHKVAICGEGADEIFGGYSRYRRATLPRLPFPARARRGVFTHSALHGERFEGWHEPMDEVTRRQSALWSSRSQVLMAVDVLERLPNCLLIKLDRALMAHGVEGRTPFLDRDVIAFAATVPDGLKANPRWGKRLLRDWLAREFPEVRPYARKRGFDVPLASWMMPRHRELAQLVGRQPGVAEVFSPDTVNAVFDNCAKDSQPAWSLLYYALWHSHHFLGVDCRGDIIAVLSEARRLGSG